MSCSGLSQPSNLIKGKNYFSSSLCMASSFNAVPEPQSTGDYAVMSCRLNPGIYMHADTSSLIFHSTGWTACLHLKKKKTLDTASDRIITE